MNSRTSGPEVLLTSTWIPPEWILAHGLRPRGLFAAPQFHSGPLTAGVCAFSQFVTWGSKEHENALTVFVTTCDQLRREFDVAGAGGLDRVFLLNVPAVWESPTAHKLFRSELLRLGGFLTRHGGRPPSHAALESALRQYESELAPLRDRACSCEDREFARALRDLHWGGAPKALGKAQPSSWTVPVALLGGPCPVMEQLVDIIDEAGGRVCLNAIEGGERSLFPRIQPANHRESPPDPLAVLVDAYLRHGADVFQRPNTPLYEWLGERLASRSARAILLWTFINCDLWRAEAASLRETFGLPVLLLEANEDGGWNERTAGRVKALIETLRAAAAPFSGLNELKI